MSETSGATRHGRGAGRSLRLFYWQILACATFACSDGETGPTGSDFGPHPDSNAFGDVAPDDVSERAASVHEVLDTTAWTTDVASDADPAGEGDIGAALPDASPPGADVPPGVDVAAPDEIHEIAAPPDSAEPADISGAGDIVEPACLVPRPVLLVHGINGSSADYTVMVQRFVDAGWPAGFVYTFDAQNPSWSCNVENAAAIDALVAKILVETGHTRIDLIAHSMGTLSTRYWLKFLGGLDKVNTYVTLGGMNHGLASPCWAPSFLGVCVWMELCETGEYIAALNADPATPGELHWVSIAGTADTTVPASSSTLDGAENITFEGVEHSGPKGLLEEPLVFDEVLRVLAYPCW